MPEGEGVTGGAFKGLKNDLKDIPWWGYAIIAGAGVFIVWKYNQSQSKTTPGYTAGSTVDQGLMTSDLAGLPFDSMSGSVPPGTSPVTQPGSPGSPAPPTPVGSSSQFATIRAKFSNPAFRHYDAGQTGVPLFMTPGGKSTSTVPFGSTISISGGPVTGGPSGASNTNSVYFPLTSGGFVAATDIAHISGSAAGGARGLGPMTRYRDEDEAGFGSGGISSPITSDAGMHVGGGGENGLFSEWGGTLHGYNADTSEYAHWLDLFLEGVG